MGQIIGFGIGRSLRAKPDWSNQEIAEFYRVQSALLQAGLKVDVERGLGDEGDPWFAFCHHDSSEIIAHFARIDGEYIVDAPALGQPLRGLDLSQIVRRFVSENPVSLPTLESKQRDNVIFHPAVLLTVFVATVLILEKPDKSFASELTDDAASTGTSESEAGTSEPHHTVRAEIPRHDDERGASEKAFLIAAITVAAGIAGEGIHRAEALQHDFLADHELFADAHSTTGDEHEPDSQPNLVDLSKVDFFDPGGSKDDGGNPPQETDTVTHVEASTVGMLAVREITVEQLVEKEEISVSAPQVKPAVHTSSASDRGLVELSKPLLLAEAAGSDEQIQPAAPTPSPSSPQASHSSAAGAWLDKEAAAAGWSFAVLDEHSTDKAQQAAEIIERIESDTKQTAADPASDDASIHKAIDAFYASDTDIVRMDYDNGSVILDSSDLSDGQFLEMHTWVFADHTTIAILGNAETVEQALADVA